MLKVIATDSLFYIMLNDTNKSVFKVFNSELRKTEQKKLFSCLNHLSYHSCGLKCQFCTRFSQIQFAYDYKIINEIIFNANLMQQGNLIDVFLARNVSVTYAHHQEY